MNAEVWLTHPLPNAMLRYLIGALDDERYARLQEVDDFPDCGVSERKLRLYAIACYRRLHEWLGDQPADAAVALTERYVDGHASWAELFAAHDAAVLRCQEFEPRWRAARDAERDELQPVYLAQAIAMYITHPLAPKGAYYASSNASFGYEALTHFYRPPEERAQAELLRDIFGNPFDPVEVAASWLTADVVALAQTMYDQRDFTLFPILSDALQDAGCDDERVITHCHTPCPHVRGCWLLDALLGKM